MEKTFLIRIHEWIGNHFIGDINEIRRRTGVSVRHDFYWPRNSLCLERATPLELTERLGENEVRRQLSKRLALMCMILSLPLSIFFSSGVPALAIGVKTVAKNTVSGVQNLSHFSTRCLLGSDSDDALKSCKQSLQAKSTAAQRRIESAMGNQTKMNAAYMLIELWQRIESAKAQGAAPEQLQAYEDQESKLGQTFSQSDIAEVKTLYAETREFNKQLRVIDAKLKANYYKDKASREGLTPNENNAYNAQLEIIKNNQ